MITNSFFKIASPLKRFLLGIASIFFFPISIAGYINYFFPETFAEHHTFKGLSDWLFSLIGLILMGWLLSEIFFPKVKIEGVVMVGSYEFCSTHPSYVLIDLLTTIFAAFWFWLGQSAKIDMPFFWLMLATAFFIPLIRLFAWYVLKLKLNDNETYEAFKPPLWAFLIFILVFAAIAFVGYEKSR